MEIHLIKFVNILECVFCLHRTISFSTFIARVLKYLHVVLELFLLLSHCVIHYFFSISYIVTTDSLFFFSITINSLVAVIIAVYKSKEYKQMLKYFNMNHLHLKADPQYNKNLKTTLMIPSVLSLLTFVQQFVIFFETRYRRLLLIFDSDICDVLYSVSLLICNLRFLFEFCALFCVINVMSEQLNSITRSVEAFEVVNEGTKPDIVGKEKLKMFDKWCATYTNVKESCKLFNNIYGLQMAMMVSTVVFTYIVFLYSLTSTSVKGKTEVMSRALYTFYLILLLVNLMMLSFAAQRTQNRVEILKRRLGKLLIHCLDNEDYYKSTKGFLRLVSSRPIRTEAFGSISVDMSLVPTCVVFFTYYTVIALQFNNIL